MWALLLAAGYVTCPGPAPDDARAPRPLALTNSDVGVAYRRMVEGWFGMANSSLHGFVRSILRGEPRDASRNMERVLFDSMPYFDPAADPAEGWTEVTYREEGLESLWRDLALDLFVDVELRSHSAEPVRGSGPGRYDVVLVPTNEAADADPAVVMEFKLFDPMHEKTLEDTVARSHAQIEERAYVTALVERGIDPNRIRTYGMAFRGKEVLVG